MAQCQVWTVIATIISSVKMRAVKLIDTTWIKSASNNNNAPYMITAPESRSLRKCVKNASYCPRHSYWSNAISSRTIFWFLCTHCYYINCKNCANRKIIFLARYNVKAVLVSNSNHLKIEIRRADRMIRLKFAFILRWTIGRRLWRERKKGSYLDRY